MISAVDSITEDISSLSDEDSLVDNTGDDNSLFDSFKELSSCVKLSSFGVDIISLDDKDVEPHEKRNKEVSNRIDFFI